MKRTHLAGLLLAASTLSLGTLAVVQAQDGKAAAPAADAKDKAHDHEHTPTTVHSGEKAFKLDDEKAYPDPDGFKSMEDRVSYAIGRNDGGQIPNSQPDLNAKTYGEGVRAGLTEKKHDYATGYAQGFELARRFLAQQEEEVDLDQFIAGIAAAIKEKDESRSIGYLIGNGYRESDLSLEADSYLAGVDEAMATAKAEPPAEGEAPKDPPKTRLTEEQVMETLQAFRAYMQAKQRQDAIDEGQAFIDNLDPEEGWKKTDSGIAYKVIQAGEGTSPDANDIATMHYEGSLIDGTVFDSSYKRGQTIAFSAQQVIKGWGEMLQLMKPGSIYQVVIPYSLAYGERGSPPSIPPFATLKFKMEMKSVEVVPNEPAPKPKKPAGQ